MNLVSKKWLVTLLTNILVVVIVVKVIVLGLLWFLPGEGVNFHPEHSLQAEFKRYRLNIMLDKGQAGAVSGKNAAAETQKLSSIVLKGLYGTKKKGFVIIAPEATPAKTEIIAVGEQFGGNKLVQINPRSAVFERNRRRYTLQMENFDTSGSMKGSGTAQRDDVPRRVSRRDINNYSKDIDKLWKDISLTEVKQGNAIKGFKITRIRPGSALARIGLKRGDVIIKANNKVLTSYADALEIYKNIGTMQAMEIVVLRNKQEKEILYEIY